MSDNEKDAEKGRALTREEIEHYRQNMKVAEDGGDLWSDEYGAFVKLCDEVIALRAEAERLSRAFQEESERADAAEARVAELLQIIKELIERATAFQRSMAAEADYQRRRDVDLDKALAEVERLRREKQ